MMERCRSFKSLECNMVKPGIMVKIEEEDLYDPQCDGCSETSAAGYSVMNPEMVIKEERNEDDSSTRNEEMYEEEESPESSSGHYVKHIVVKHEQDEGAYGIAEQQFEDRISSPEPSPDYIVVKIKEEEEEPYGMDYQPAMGRGSHPLTNTGREKPRRGPRMSSKMVIDIDLLIQMVHDRPELYDPKVPSYADRYKKKKAWDEICAIVVPDWDLCSEREKNLKAKEIQTRWRSLKDCFRRELTLQKKLESSGLPTHRRRKYVHYEGLLFLEPTMRLRDPVAGSAAPTSTCNNRDPVEILQPIDIEGPATPPPPPPPPLPPPPAPTPPPPKRIRKKAANTSESEWETHLLDVMNALKEKSEEQSDADDIFLRSLLPFVKKVPEERKIDMQLSMMHVVKRFMEPPAPPRTHRHSNNCHQIPPQPALKPTRRHQRPTSPHPSTPALDPSHKPVVLQTHPAAPHRSQEPDFIHGPEPSSSPSSSSSSINPSPQSQRDSPYYFDL
ncbi:uncharacterized protein ACNLHF_028483 isoform 3-T3 [Anomaloglossus baeobatrachus]|uniref:uncharacterized protein LOC142250855 isoform X3 n=1 Tax=Anomaloglossus baeobatrachus TaxID=238106 RepID=UPI003F4FF89A